MTNLIPQTFTILVADNNEVNRNILSDILKGEGYQIIFAQNGNDAIKLCKEKETACLNLN